MFSFHKAKWRIKDYYVLDRWRVSFSRLDVGVLQSLTCPANKVKGNKKIKSQYWNQNNIHWQLRLPKFPFWEARKTYSTTFLKRKYQFLSSLIVQLCHWDIVYFESKDKSIGSGFESISWIYLAGGKRLTIFEWNITWCYFNLNWICRTWHNFYITHGNG